MADSVLVTGGASYIGSHIVVELARSGRGPVVVDNFTNSSRECSRGCGTSPARPSHASRPTSATAKRSRAHSPTIR